MSGRLAKVRRAALGWGRCDSKHLMHHTTRGRMPESVRGSRAHGERASAQRSTVGTLSFSDRFQVTVRVLGTQVYFSNASLLRTHALPQYMNNMY